MWALTHYHIFQHRSESHQRESNRRCHLFSDIITNLQFTQQKIWVLVSSLSLLHWPLHPRNPKRPYQQTEEYQKNDASKGHRQHPLGKNPSVQWYSYSFCLLLLSLCFSIMLLSAHHFTFFNVFIIYFFIHLSVLYGQVFVIFFVFCFFLSNFRLFVCLFWLYSLRDCRLCFVGNKWGFCLSGSFPSSRVCGFFFLVKMFYILGWNGCSWLLSLSLLFLPLFSAFLHLFTSLNCYVSDGFA